MKRTNRTGEIAYIFEAGLEYFISLFVTGTMLGYILDTLGFSDALQGIIATVATFTCGAQLFALFLSGRRRKRMVTVGNLINQLCFTLLYLLPIFSLDPVVKTALLMALLIGGHIVNNALTPSRTIWLMGSVPDERRGRFTAVKEMVSLAGGIVVSLVFGAVADTFRDTAGMPTRPYYIICTVALIIMMALHTVCLLVSTEKEPVAEERISVKSTVARMLRNPPLLKVVLVNILFYIANALSVSFFVSYTRQELAYSFTALAVITTAGSLLRIAISPLFGKLADKYSFSTSVTLGYTMAALGFIAMVFATPATRWLYIVHTCLYTGGYAAINSGTINLVYDYVAPSERMAALGVQNAVGGILSFFAALLAGFLMGEIQAAGGFKVFGFTLYAQQVLALLSAVVVIGLIVYMRLVIAPMHRVRDEK